MTDKSGQPSSRDEPGRQAPSFTLKRRFTFGEPPQDHPDTAFGPAPAQSFKWEWRGAEQKTGGDGGRLPDALSDGEKPATYYEALSGRRDPLRNFLVNARRIIRIGVWIIAIGLPVGLITLAVITGQSLETIFWVGLASAIVGLMFASSFPKTPFD